MSWGDYSVIRRIGEGGSGLTYLVEDSNKVKHCLKESNYGKAYVKNIRKIACNIRDVYS